MNKPMARKMGFLLATVLLFSLLFTGCSSKMYQVKVVDALGQPYTSGVVVRFLQDGKQVAMQAVNEQGIAEKELDGGDYEVDLVFTSDADAFHFEKGLVISGEEKSLTVQLAAKVKQTETLVIDNVQKNAGVLEVGCTYAEVKKGERTYFFFTPTASGTYEFSLPGSDATLGYYGSPYYVQDLSLVEAENGVLSVSVSASMIGTGGSGTTTLVLGVDSDEADSCVIAIRRAGEAERTIEDEPWTIYKKTVELKEYTLPAGAKLKDFDLTAETYELVLNETDGFYHLNTKDGPLALVYLGEPSAYLDDFKTILEHSGVVKYFYDEDGNYLKKESYSECLLEYIDCMDEEAGVYPLTEDLKYIICHRGDASGWFDSASATYIFKDRDGNLVPGLNEENLWLFMCCYLAD